jgi:hypothetical protein
LKKLIIGLIGLTLLVAFSAHAQEVKFHNANQFTIGWEAVTADIDGDPVSGVTYKMLLANADTDPGKTNPAVVYEGAATVTTITIPKKGRYFVGLQATAYGLNGAINWADAPKDQEGYELFGIRFAVPPDTPKGIVRQ